MAEPAPPTYILSTPSTHTAIDPLGPDPLVATLVLSYCTALVVMDVYPAGVAPFEPEDEGLLPLAACTYDATATALYQSASPVAVVVDILMVLLVIAVVPVTVTAMTRFLIHENTVPVAVGMATGVVPVWVSTRLKTIPVSALAHDTLAPVPSCAWQVAAPIVLLL